MLFLQSNDGEVTLLKANIFDVKQLVFSWISFVCVYIIGPNFLYFVSNQSSFSQKLGINFLFNFFADHMLAARWTVCGTEGLLRP